MGGQQMVIYLIAVIVPLISTAARAEDKTGWATSFGIGGSMIRDTDGDDTFRANEFAYNWGPEYRYSERWALGVDFFGIGSGTDDFNGVETTIDVGGFELRGRYIMPLSDGVEMYGRLGYAAYFAEVDPGGNTAGEGAVTLGVGFDVGRGEHWTFRLDGRYLQGPSDESGAIVTAGFNYRF